MNPSLRSRLIFILGTLASPLAAFICLTLATPALADFVTEEAITIAFGDLPELYTPVDAVG